MLDAALGERISIEVNKAYRELNASCKPIVRSNGVKEWTVLAGVVAVDRMTNKLRLISIATGVKALPDFLLVRSGGRMVHDCHAEILALRAFNTVLLRQISELAEDPALEQDLVVRSSLTRSYAIRDNWELALYISTLPCGDASMELLTADEDGATIQDDDPIQFIDPSIKSIVRGRLNYSKRGIVRTKPGRFDSQITLSKSCSDKLCMKQSTSILNSMTWSLMEKPIYLKYLVCTSGQDCLEKSFHERITGDNFVPLQFLRCSEGFVDAKQTDEEQPSSMSSVKLFISKRNVVEEAILNGVKNGFYTKRSKPLRKNCAPIVSRYDQWQIYKRIKTDLPDMSYLKFKASNTQRNDLLCNTRDRLSPEGWINTFRDDLP